MSFAEGGFWCRRYTGSTYASWDLIGPNTRRPLLRWHYHAWEVWQ